MPETLTNTVTHKDRPPSEIVVLALAEMSLSEVLKTSLASLVEKAEALALAGAIKDKE